MSLVSTGSCEIFSNYYYSPNKIDKLNVELLSPQKNEPKKVISSSPKKSVTSPVDLVGQIDENIIKLQSNIEIIKPQAVPPIISMHQNTDGIPISATHSQLVLSIPVSLGDGRSAIISVFDGDNALVLAKLCLDHFKVTDKRVLKTVADMIVERVQAFKKQKATSSTTEVSKISSNKSAEISKKLISNQVFDYKRTPSTTSSRKNSFTSPSPVSKTRSINTPTNLSKSDVASKHARSASSNFNPRTPLNAKTVDNSIHIEKVAASIPKRSASTSKITNEIASRPTTPRSIISDNKNSIASYSRLGSVTPLSTRSRSNSLSSGVRQSTSFTPTNYSKSQASRAITPNEKSKGPPPIVRKPSLESTTSFSSQPYAKSPTNFPSRENLGMLLFNIDLDMGHDRKHKFSVFFKFLNSFYLLVL